MTRDLFHEVTTSDISTGHGADFDHLVKTAFSKDICRKIEISSYRNAAAILNARFPERCADIKSALAQFRNTQRMIRTPGGSKGPFAKYVDTLFTEENGWHETRISTDLSVKLLHAHKKDHLINSYVRQGFLDGHRIDFLHGRLALDLEWNSKDQTYDCDLYAFSAFYHAGAIDVGIVITRGAALDTDYLRGLGKVLNKDGSQGTQWVYKKFGASTPWMGKLLYRLDAGRNGGCPVLAIGITPHCVAR